MRQSFPQTHEEKLAYLRELREEAVHSASEEAVEKQHAKGKLTARERIEKLLDPGSFEELDTFVRHRTTEFGMDKRRPWGDAVVTGYGVVIHLGGDAFLVAARGASVRFARSGELVEWDTLTEGTVVDGQWRPGRTLNGDERYFMFPPHDLRVVRIELLRRPIRVRR